MVRQTCPLNLLHYFMPDPLGETLNWSDSDQLGRVRRTLGDLSAGLSETARLKQGLESLSDRGVYHDLKAFLGKLRSLGVFLVPCGELEDWVPHLMDGAPSKKKKPERANFMANKIRAAPSEPATSGRSSGK